MIALDTVPNLLISKLTDKNMLQLFSADEKQVLDFSAYCVFRAIAELYQRNAQSKSLHAYLQQRQQRETGLTSPVPENQYESAKRISREL